MFLISLFIFACIGLVAGFLGGLLGVGGGVIVVPSLLATFYLLGFPTEHIMQMAAGTSLAAMVLTSSSSAWAHYQRNGIDWNLQKFLAPGILLGATSGAALTHLFRSPQLYFFFSLFLCLLGIYFLIPSKRDFEKNTFSYTPWKISLVGLMIGWLSSFFGIGGGSITVPTLTTMGLPLRNAISTSAISGFFVALTGAVTFALIGLHHESVEGSVGFLYLPAFLSVGLCACFAASQGAKWSYILPPPTLWRIFGGFILLIGLIMLKVHP